MSAATDCPRWSPSMARAARARAPSAAPWPSRVGWHLLDSGALYRLVALAGVPGRDPARGPPPATPRLATTHAGALRQRAPDGAEQVSLAGRDVTAEIRSEDRRAGGLPGGRLAGGACGAPGAPAGLRRTPRAWWPMAAIWAPWSSPGAHLKIFLTASPEERALRRHKQLKDKGSDVSLPALSREIAERDCEGSDPSGRTLEARARCLRDRLDRTVGRGGGGTGAGAGSRSSACGAIAARRDTHGRF